MDNRRSDQVYIPLLPLCNDDYSASVDQITTLGLQPNTSGCPLDTLNNVLGVNEKLIFVSTCRIGDLKSNGNSAQVVQLQDPSGQVVMSTLHTAGQNFSTHGSDNTILVGAITSFLDVTSRVLLTTHGDANGHFSTVFSGDKLLGVVEGFGAFRENIVAKECVLGQIVLRVVKVHGTGSKLFKFLMANGMEIGKFEMSQQGRIVLSFSHNLDAQTKGFLLSTSYILYLDHFMVTKYGRGQNQAYRRSLYFTCFFMVGLIIVTFILIFIAEYFQIKLT